MSDIMVAERKEIEVEINPVVTAAQALQVVDAVSYTQAMELGKACSLKIKIVEKKLGPSKQKTWDAYQEVMKLMKSFIDPLTRAKDDLAKRGYTWQKAEEKRKIEEASRLALADRLEKEGMKEQAAEVLDAPINVAVAEVAAPAPAAKVEGTSPQEIWKGEVENEVLIPREYMTPDLVKLNQATKMLKGETRIPGWRVFDAGRMKFRP